MLMSKSRLEKFLYALYSLDSRDLPNPLSRIEELYKCWVTGEEVPTFEPISRTEKYLMAILGVYDVNELPNPISRVEVLLHKLAIGDDNLDDIKSFLSEHEELLAEIIRNGGAGGNIDIEYILYSLSTEFNTLYNTAEKPVKSAILKGSTKYRDIDTGDILDTFDETKNLEFVSVKMPVLTTSNEDGTKTNILTVNEEIELCEVNGTHDELNLLTGELTQRVHEFVLDGSEKWKIVSSEDRVNTSLYRADNIIADDLAKVTWGVDHGVSLPIPYRWNTYDNDEEGVVFTQPSGHCYIRSTIRNLSDFTQWLMANPITIQYELATESIKTVDLSTVNRDENNTELSTFNDITYVTLSSEGLIPEAELEVATKNEEVLSTMSLEMDDISATQTTLEETSNTQSENVDATMIATTEIYEELL